MSIQFRTRSRGFGVNPDTLMGACCSDDDYCTVTSFRDCYDSDGMFFAGRDCTDTDNNPCLVEGGGLRSLYGICCDSHGFCTFSTEEDCESRDGTWKGKRFDCLSYDCCAGSAAELQACCVGNFIKGVSGDYSWAGICSDLKPCECLNLGGVPRGPDSSCKEVNAAGGCGVTGATAYGSCCLEGNCHSPSKNYVNGYTAGDCAVLGGLWGGSGSTCGSGTTFDNSWPCSWPTGACCFGDNPYNGITYCDHGKTFGDCLSPPPGGSGGSAWTVGATCGTLIDIDGVLCIPTRDAEGTDRGTCCIPEYFGVENPDLDPFVVNYSCHVTNKNKCISLGGLWSNEETFCSYINCCELHGDCTLGPNGSCCQFRKFDNEFFRCDNIPLYSCEQIAASNSNIVTLFYEGEECNDENGYPCKDAIFVTDSCCLWQPDGTYIGCQNIGENDACPPAPEYIGIRFDQPCDSAGFDCSIQEFGACCVGPECITASRSVCLDLGGMFYSGKNCINDCDSIPCCNQKDNEVVACYNKHNLPIEDLGSDRCLDSYHVATQHLDKEFAAEYLAGLGINNPDAVHFFGNSELNKRCEDCDYSCSSSRGSCCWDGKCIPTITQEECNQLGGVFRSCDGLPFENISDSWRTNNPCIGIGCSQARRFDSVDCSDDDPIGACCNDKDCADNIKQSACSGTWWVGGVCCLGEDPTDLSGACCSGGICQDLIESECSGFGTYYGDGTSCGAVDPYDPCGNVSCCLGEVCTNEVKGLECYYNNGVIVEDCDSYYDADDDDYDCPSANPIAACCNGNSCSLTTEEDCGGIWHSNNFTCSEFGNPCIDSPNCVDCIDTRPCCVGGTCYDETQSECDALGGIWQEHAGNVLCDNNDVSGVVLCNYCEWKTYSEEHGDSWGSQGDAACRCCCGVDDSCTNWKTYQEYVECISPVDNEFCEESGVASYTSDTTNGYCPESGGCGGGACCLGFNENVEGSCSMGNDDGIDWRAETCNNIGGVYMGDGTICPDGTDNPQSSTNQTWCLDNLRPCCNCGDNCRGGTDPDDSCDNDEGPGQPNESPPWTGTNCHLVTHREGSPNEDSCTANGCGKLFPWGTNCIPLSSGSLSNDNCDGAIAAGACCSCHPWSHWFWPGDEDAWYGDGPCDCGAGDCIDDGNKNDCDYRNCPWLRNCDANGEPVGCCTEGNQPHCNPDDSSWTIGDEIPSVCNSKPGTKQEDGKCFTFWEGGDCSVNDGETPWSDWSCSVGQICAAAWSESPGSSNIPCHEDLPPWTGCWPSPGPNDYTMLEGTDRYGVPWNRLSEHAGGEEGTAARRMDGDREGPPGCPECFTQGNVSPMPHAVFSFGRSYMDCSDCATCESFGACCYDWNDGTYGCGRWSKTACEKLGGVYIGDVPCHQLGCGDKWSESGTQPFGAECDNVCSNYVGNFRGNEAVRYQPFIYGKVISGNYNSIPFFGFKDVENKPIDIPDDALPPSDDSTRESLIYYKIGNNESSIIEGVPFPTNPTTYQYMMGYGTSTTTNNIFSWGMFSGKENDFKEYKNSIRYLWLTRKYQTPENAELANMFEPYYHSKVNFSQVPNLTTLVINPAQYGNGRYEFGEEDDWKFCTDRVGYYIGVYLTRDISKGNIRGSKLRTLIATDSSCDTSCTSMQYINLTPLEKLEVVHLNNNELYRIDVQQGNNIKELWAQDNKLGEFDTSWLKLPGYPEAQSEFPLHKLPNIERLIVSRNNLTSLLPNNYSAIFNNLTSIIASNNPNLHVATPFEIVAPSLEYLDLSNCSLRAGINLVDAHMLKQVLLNNSSDLTNFGFNLSSNITMKNFDSLSLTNTNIPFLNLGAGSQQEWGESGLVGDFNEYGHAFLNLTYADLRNNTKLRKIELPAPEKVYNTTVKRYLRYVNVNRTAIGENDGTDSAPGIDAFFSQSAFMSPESYPVGHVLEVSARNITDLNGNHTTVSLETYNNVINKWDGSKRFIVFDVDIDK